MDTTTLPTGTWELATTTTVQLTIKKLKLITVEATVDVIDGYVTVGDDGTVSAVTARLSAASFDTGNEKRDTHVQSGDFLDAENHPEITFTSTSVEPSAGGHLVNGTITLKGRASSLTLLVGDITVDGGAATFTATSTIDRKAVGIDKMPSLVISQMIDLRIDARCEQAS